jgi:hypothetical protein
MNKFLHYKVFCYVCFMCDGISPRQIVGVILFVMWSQCLFTMG